MKIVERDFHGRKLSIEVGRLAKQASGSALIRYGDTVVLGISHPCTTFDKWRWMPVVEDDGAVSGAVRTCF